MNTKKWTKKDGTKIRIKDMDNSHLVNTIKFLDRQQSEIQSCPYPSFQGEMAQMYAEAEYDALMRTETNDNFPIYIDLKNEAIRRGLIKET
jgi:hypothetical protein